MKGGGRGAGGSACVREAADGERGGGEAVRPEGGGGGGRQGTRELSLQWGQWRQSGVH